MDLRIGLDLVAHARNAALDVVFLVSGDDDLTETVEEAQAHGVQVTILAVPNKKGDPHDVSRHLRRAADGLDLLPADALDAAVSPRAGAVSQPVLETAQSQPPVPSPSLFANRAPAPTSVSPTTVSPSTPTSEPHDAARADVNRGDSDKTAENIGQVVSRVLETSLDSCTAEQRTQLVASRPSIPPDVDPALLLDLSRAMGVHDLTDTGRYQLRARFRVEVDQTERA